MLRSTTTSIRNATSSLAKLTNKGEPAHWPSGAPSQSNGRFGSGRSVSRVDDSAVTLTKPTGSLNRGGGSPDYYRPTLLAGVGIHASLLVSETGSTDRQDRFECERSTGLRPVRPHETKPPVPVRDS